MILKVNFIPHFFITLINLELVIGILTRPPQNAAVIRGTPVVLTCNTDSDLPLTWTASESESESTVLTLSAGLNINRKFQSRYKINGTSDGQFDLIIDTSFTENALTYIAYEPITEETMSADVIILDSHPQISTSCTDIPPDDNDVKVTCSVNVTGNWMPHLKWMNDDDDSKIKTTCTSIIDRSRSFTCTISSMASQFSSKEARCKVFFNKHGKPNETSALNAPQTHHSKQVSLTHDRLCEDPKLGNFLSFNEAMNLNSGISLRRKSFAVYIVAGLVLVQIITFKLFNL